MLLYSKTINSFTAKVKKMAKKIMNEEMGLSFKKTRFEWRGYYYPLSFVLFEDPSLLGYFCPEKFHLGLHKRLMYLSCDEVLSNIIRHELAHLYCFLLYRNTYALLPPHGREFHELCHQFNWGRNISKAYAHLESENKSLAPFSKGNDFLAIKEKIEKLLKLSSSDNPHEAELATLKANELLLKYNMKHLNLSDIEEERETCVSVVYKSPRLNATLHALYAILEHFYVRPIINKNAQGATLEVLGNRESVEMAEYVATFLTHEFENLWKKAKETTPGLKGLKMKNNYIQGLSQGLCQKLSKEEEKSYQNLRTKKELIRFKSSLDEQFKMVFPQVSKGTLSQGSFDFRAQAKGREDGMNLSLRPGVKQRKGLSLLSFQ